MQILQAYPEGQPSDPASVLEDYRSQTTKSGFRPEKHQQGEGGAGFSKNKNSRQRTGCG